MVLLANLKEEATATRPSKQILSLQLQLSSDDRPVLEKGKLIFTRRRTCRPAAAAAAPVVGWPPVRSFRRNLAASKPSSSKEDGRATKGDDVAVKGADERAGRKGLFVKVNMDGVPIGRKVELKENGSYVDLCATVDKLFRSLLAGTHPHTPCIIDLTLSVSLVLVVSLMRVFPVCACSSKGHRRCPRRDRRRRVHAGVRGRRG